MRITYPFEITRFWTKTFAFFADARQYVGMSALTPLTTSEAAGVYGVSPRTIAYAKKAISIGSAALVAALETGRISVLGAAWLADNADASVQDWVVADPRRAVIRRRLRIARRDPEAAERAAGWRNPGLGPGGTGFRARFSFRSSATSRSRRRGPPRERHFREADRLVKAGRPRPRQP